MERIFTAVTLDEAEENLFQFAEKWQKRYPSCVKRWEEHRDVLTAFYEYPPEIRKIIYTTNIIEELNRQFRQITMNKPSFTSDDFLCRMLYLSFLGAPTPGTVFTPSTARIPPGRRGMKGSRDSASRHCSAFATLVLTLSKNAYTRFYGGASEKEICSYCIL